MNSFAFSISMPPSANNMFATVIIKGKVRQIISRDYKAWKKGEAEKLVASWRAAGAPAFDRHLALTIHLGLNYKGDIDNRVKPITDLLRAIPDFPDDRWIDRISVERVPGLNGARVLIMQGGA